MVPSLKSGWSKPSTILFATEFPTNEKAFAFALAQARDFGANLIVLHVYNRSASVALPASGIQDGFAAARAVKHLFDPLAQRAANLNIQCRIVVRHGAAAVEILNFLREQNIDRLVMGARTPGATGKLLVGSVAEAILRTSHVPVSLVGPYVEEGTYRNLATRTILCSVGAHESRDTVACFAAELAAKDKARLILQHVIPPQECSEALFGRTVDQIKADLLAMIPAAVRQQLNVQTNVMLGDPAEELLYQGRVLPASLIVIGAYGATHFAAVTHAGVVYKVLAYARCPVMTLSPVVLAESSSHLEMPLPVEVNYLAGVI
jgi:nucleotide-binding universal stress UspA family protein